MPNAKKGSKYGSRYSGLSDSDFERRSESHRTISDGSLYGDLGVGGHVGKTDEEREEGEIQVGGK